MGVHRVNFAGELGYKSLFGITFTQSGACLYGIAKEFADEFEIKGVKGAIYPPEPPATPDDIWRKLYFDQVPIPPVPAKSSTIVPSGPAPTPPVPAKDPAKAMNR